MNTKSRGNIALWAIVILVAIVAIPRLLGSGGEFEPANTVPDQAPSAPAEAVEDAAPTVGEETGRISKEKLGELSETGKALKDGPGTKAVEDAKNFKDDFLKGFNE